MNPPAFGRVFHGTAKRRPHITVHWHSDDQLIRGLMMNAACPPRPGSEIMVGAEY